MERRNITNEFLKESIADALLKLMEEKPMESISITEIIDLAGAGRSTYYRNFTSKEDILAFKLRILAVRWIKTEGITEETPGEVIIKKICENLYNIRAVLELCNRNGLMHMIGTVIYELMGPIETDSKIDRYQKASESFSIYGIIFQWVQDGMKEDVEELSEIILELLKNKKETSNIITETYNLCRKENIE